MWKCSLSSCSRWSLKSHAHFCCANYSRLIKMFEPGNMAFFLHWIWDVGSFWAKKEPHALSASSEKLEENPICKRLIASVLSQRVSHWFDMGTRQHICRVHRMVVGPLFQRNAQSTTFIFCGCFWMFLLPYLRLFIQIEGYVVCKKSCDVWAQKGRTRMQEISNHPGATAQLVQCRWW